MRSTGPTGLPTYSKIDRILIDRNVTFGVTGANSKVVELATTLYSESCILYKWDISGAAAAGSGGGWLPSQLAGRTGYEVFGSVKPYIRFGSLGSMPKDLVKLFAERNAPKVSPPVPAQPPTPAVPKPVPAPHRPPGASHAGPSHLDRLQSIYGRRCTHPEESKKGAGPGAGKGGAGKGPKGTSPGKALGKGTGPSKGKQAKGSSKGKGTKGSSDSRSTGSKKRPAASLKRPAKKQKQEIEPDISASEAASPSDEAASDPPSSQQDDPEFPGRNIFKLVSLRSYSVPESLDALESFGQECCRTCREWLSG